MRASDSESPGWSENLFGGVLRRSISVKGQICRGVYSQPGDPMDGMQRQEGQASGAVCQGMTCRMGGEGRPECVSGASEVSLEALRAMDGMGMERHRLGRQDGHPPGAAALLAWCCPACSGGSSSQGASSGRQEAGAESGEGLADSFLQGLSLCCF